jgi:hypothetical protein
MVLEIVEDLAKAIVRLLKLFMKFRMNTGGTVFLRVEEYERNGM